MKTYVITEESKRRAIRIYYQTQSFGDAIDALLVEGTRAKFVEMGLQPSWCVGHFEGERCNCKPPFGPGTKLRASNGDELRVVSFGPAGEGTTFLYVINLSASSVQRVSGEKLCYSDPEELRRDLLGSGAAIIA